MRTDVPYRADPIGQPVTKPLSASVLDRVVVVGTSCSGKTTLGRDLAAVLSCPHIELDAIHWLPDWQSRPLEEFREVTERSIAGDRWVIEGNYSQVRDIIWPKATAVIWLNYSFPLVFSRAVRRTITRALTKEELFSGNRESIRQSFFSRGSILLWVIKTHWRRRREFRQLLGGDAFPHLTAYEFRHPREAAAFLSREKGARRK
jgi:adenylate kinase family enzyme